MSVEEDIPQPTVSAQKISQTTASTHDVPKTTQSEVTETIMLAGEMPKSTLSADESHKITPTAEEMSRLCTVSGKKSSQTSSETFAILRPSSVDIHGLVMRSDDEEQHTLVQNEG